MTLALLGLVLALVGNLATNLIEVEQWWWRPSVFAALGVLAVGALALEAVRHRAERVRAQLGSVGVQSQVFGALPRQAWQWQPRLQEEKAVREALGRRGRAALVALPGARGAGKSQLAAAYARWCLNQGYDLVAWINTESGPVPELAALAAYLDLQGVTETAPEQAATAVCRWLERDGQARRLLVFDNVDDPDALRKYLPTTGSTKVLITTNRREFTTMGGIAVVEVSMFTPTEGAAFLARATGLDPVGDGARLGEQLGWLPLGLAQAAAFIARTEMSYTEYAELLRRQDLDETLRQQAGADHPGVLKATQLSLAGLARADPSGDTARLLRVLSLLSPDGVSRDQLVQAEQHLGLHGGVWPTINALLEASLVTLGGDAQAGSYGEDRRVVAVHRLTALVVRYEASRAPGDDQAAALETATQLLDALTSRFPRHQVALRRGELDELTAHLDAVRGHTDDPSPLLLTQAKWIAGLLEHAGDLTRAIPLFEQTLADWERMLGAEHPHTLTSQSDLAYAYRSVRRLEEAITLLEQNVAVSERVRGAEHPHTLISRNNLASTYETAGRLDEAITLHEQNLADRERVLGAEHPDTLISRNNLAGVYDTAGRLDEAITLHEQNLADRERVLGAEHPDTLISRNNLASAYDSAGRLDEAITLNKQNLADRERVLGAEHPDTLTSRNNLASAYRSAGRLDEAITLHEQNLAACERVLGPAHPITDTVRGNLTEARRGNGV
ncbi:FxSxx-COOH system tetratricopeptide repeat protein [Amycolatopsis sp. NBRC 101858]|uniref:FxSxx-COOH system tetratricopeptide repeat protein n=1 Tax=Amycolatopsis sp. NBRC 101858 TaxID=3032200 RepID=UPI00255347DD|nr:FxSxx-COOH system tetratricopeptide repeat protein [Amycolatopsis sp. NBRC 101858]